MAGWTTPDDVHSFCDEEIPTPAEDAIDDNTGSYWRHNATSYHWIIFDMGSSETISKVRLYQAGYADYRWGVGEGVTVYVGNNPADMGAAVWEGLMNVGDGWQESGEFSKAGRYVKLVSKSDSDIQRMYEFDAYVVAGVAHEKTVTELLGLVDSHTRIGTFHKTTTELLGLIDTIERNKCPKCKVSIICIF